MAGKFKLQVGYGYIRDYLIDRRSKLKNQKKISKADRVELNHLDALINDCEYLEHCAEVVACLQPLNRALKIVEEL